MTLLVSSDMDDSLSVLKKRLKYFEKRQEELSYDYLEWQKEKDSFEEQDKFLQEAVAEIKKSISKLEENE